MKPYIELFDVRGT